MKISRFAVMAAPLAVSTIVAMGQPAAAANVSKVGMPGLLPGNGLSLQSAPLVPTESVAPIEESDKLDRESYSAFMNATLTDGRWLAGAWIDPGTLRVVGAVAYGAPPEVIKWASGLVGAQGELRFVKFSWDALVESQEHFYRDGTFVDVDGLVVAVSVSEPLNRVVVHLAEVTDLGRQQVASVGGEPAVVSTESIPVAKVTSGPNQWKDRYPYTGGAGFQQYGAVSSNPFCTTAFSMITATGAALQLTAGHCANPQFQGVTNAASLAGTSWSLWNNVVGSTQLYTNSLCATTGSSCDRGSTKYGDISAIAVTGNEPYFWTYGPHGTTKAPVGTQETNLPYVGESVCASGAIGGVVCGLTVVDNFIAISVDGGRLLTPMVQATPTGGNCSTFGDSGGSIFKPVGGINRAVGVHSAIATDQNGTCVAQFFTSIYYAQALYNATVTTI